MRTALRRGGERLWLFVLAACVSAAASADVIAVQCTIDQYKSSFAPRPGLFTVMVDLQMRTMVTYYGEMPLKMTRRELHGAATVADGWQINVAIDRNTGKFVAGTDKIDGRKYSYTVLKGLCILPQALQGSKYKSPAQE